MVKPDNCLEKPPTSSLRETMRWTRIEFHGSFPEGAVLPTFKGSMLRGALGFALKRTVCAVRVKVCEPCLLRPSCVYARIFRG